VEPQTKTQAFRARIDLLHRQMDPHGPFRVIALKMSLAKALKDRARLPEILKSIHAEIENLMLPGVQKALHYLSIPKALRKEIINTFLFHKVKFNADGVFEKDKCRIVALSNQRDHNSIGETTAPTVNPVSVFATLNKAAADFKQGVDIELQPTLSAYDIKGAFLVTPMRNRRMFIKVTGELLEQWLHLHPQLREFYDEQQKSLFFELDRYLYGLHEAPHEFNSLLDKKLQDIGFKPSEADPCLYTKESPDGIIVLCLHVDDMLLLTPGRKYREWFEREMGVSFELVKQYDTLSFLGMRIWRDPITGSIKVTQSGFVRELLRKHGYQHVTKPPSTPAALNLLESSEDSARCDQKQYLSLAMSLMYLARFTRVDILMPVSFLSARSESPSEEDLGKLHRVLRYLSGTQNVGLEFRGGEPLVPHVYADASHHTYPTGHGQAGMIITLGSAPIATRSFKIKLMTRSTSESELCALEESSTYAVWLRVLLRDLRVEWAAETSSAVPVFQDNQSTIIMAVQGGSFKRTKHMIGRATFVSERIANGDIAIKYLSTDRMPADMLTKPLGKALLKRFMDLVDVRVCEQSV
jgi:hypothetical protein